MLCSQWIALKYCTQDDRLSQQQLSFLVDLCLALSRVILLVFESWVWCQSSSSLAFLQRVSIACYAERCISHDRFCPSDRPTVCHTLVSCQNDSSIQICPITVGHNNEFIKQKVSLLKMTTPGRSRFMLTPIKMTLKDPSWVAKNAECHFQSARPMYLVPLWLSKNYK